MCRNSQSQGLASPSQGHLAGTEVRGPRVHAACPIYRLSLQGIGVQRDLAADKSNLKLLRLAAGYQQCLLQEARRKPKNP